MSTPKVSVDDLSPEVRKRLNLKAPRKAPAFSKEHVRQHAIRALGALSDLTQEQRRRVLEHAAKLNRV